MTPVTASSPLRRLLACAAAGFLLAAGSAHADEKFVYATNWFAQAEHGGFYQALATGQYKKAGLDVTIKMGGPQVNIMQLMAAGLADCVMGSSDLQMIQARQNGVPVVTVAAMFQKSPQAIIAHDDVKSFEQMKGKTFLLAAAAQNDFWPWLKAKFGFSDAQIRPYTFSVQPFIADPNAVQQGFITSEPYALQKAGIKSTALLMADHGYPSYATTITCMDKTLKERPAAVAAFVKATVEGWKGYLANPALANVLIRKENPGMTDEQLAFSWGKLKDYQLVTAGDAATQGIGVITDARAKASYDFLVSAKLIDPARVELSKTYSTEFVKNAKVLP